MDPVTIATAAAAALAPYLADVGKAAAGTVGAAAGRQLQRLYERITGRLSQDETSGGQEALARLRLDPHNQVFRADLADVLARAISCDPRFGAEMADDIKNLEGGPGTVSIHNEITGDARVEKIANFGNVTGSVTF